MTTQTAACLKCGGLIPARAQFCPECGTPVPTLAADAATSERPAISTPADAAVTISPTGSPAHAAVTVSPTGIATSPGTGAFRPGADGPFRAGDQVGPRYTIIRLLGMGGMGAVYQAFDHELGVGLAIKVIRPAANADSTAAADLEQRFKRELVLARQITHKYVVRIHDIGDVDGIKYLTMPFIEGETLADLLRRDGKLPIARTLAIATQVALGLAAAHDKGIVHRDLKPENIMIEKGDGDALIMDFGIARSVEAGSTQTAAGAIIGTLEYMAPEQAQGRPVDGRTDLYSMGLIIRDCLIGRQRAGQENPMTELVKRITEPPPAPRQLDPTIPEALDAVVRRCLRPDPAERFASTHELVSALQALTSEGHERVATAVQSAVVVPSRPRWHFAVAAALVVVAAIGGWMLSRGRGPLVPAGPRDPVSVLVAEFDNKTGDVVFNGVLEQALSLGLEGATFITAYPQRDALRSAAAIKSGSRLDESTARLVAVRDGVKLVLAGSIEASGSGYAIKVRAIDAAVGKDVASAQSTAGDKGLVLGAVGELATKMRQELGDSAAETGQAGRETFTAASLEAARAYVLGQELAAAGKFGEAIAQYQDAVQRDPNFGRAYAGWANAAFRAGRPDEADQYFKKALALMERMTEREKYRTLGGYYMAAGANDEQAVENYRMLVEHYPSDGPGLNNLAVAYFRTLDFKRAFEQGKKATEIYPSSLNYRTNLALYAMYAGDFAAGAEEAKKAIAIGAFDKAYLPIAMNALAAGKPDEARAAYAEMAKVSTRGASIASLGRADASIYEGKYDEARAELQTGAASDEAGNLRAPRALKLIALAEIAGATGQTREATTQAEQALSLSNADAVVVPSARLFVASGRVDAAATHAAALEKQVQKRSRALAAVIRAEISLAGKRPVEAIDALTAARGLADLWLVRYTLGRAYVEQERYAEAIAELEACQKRIGEATDVFLDDWPTFRYTVPLKYWLARAQQGLGQADSAKKNYDAYLALRGNVTGDALAADVRKRIAP